MPLATGHTHACHCPQVSDIPAESLSLPPTATLAALYQRDPDAFIIESCRVDPPVTSACATFAAPGTGVELGVGCCGVSTRVKQGTPLQYVFGGVAGPNRDATVFEEPNRFNPGVGRRQADSARVRRTPTPGAAPDGCPKPHTAP